MPEAQLLPTPQSYNILLLKTTTIPIFRRIQRYRSARMEARDGSLEGDGLETGDGSLSPLLRRGDKEPSPSYYVKPKALIYKGLRQLTISLYLSKQS